MSTSEPSAAIIAKLKEEHGDRSLHHVEIDHEGVTYHFLMTGPNEPEYKKFMGELLDAKDKAKESDQMDGIRTACAVAAKAQIRWPERAEVETLFRRFPAMPHRFREKIHEFVAASSEVRSKKL